MERIRHIYDLPVADQNNAALELLVTVRLSSEDVFLLGSRHDPSIQSLHILEHVMSLCRMTYRTAFPPVEGFSTDVGWGCMLRTAQMTVANALIRIYLNRDWKVMNLTSDAEKARYCEIIKLFADSWEAPLSIQNIANQGKQLDKAVGQWFGPTTACHVVKRIVMASMPDRLRVYVAQDGVVSDSDVEAACDGWKRPLLIFVPLRLGLDQIDLALARQASYTLTWPQSIGILGGKVRASYYFVGMQGDSLLYLDPHFPQPTLDMSSKIFSYESLHSHQLSRMPCSELDPSLALAFVCSYKEEYADLKRRVTRQQSGSGLFVFISGNGNSYAYMDDALAATSSSHSNNNNNDMHTKNASSNQQDDKDDQDDKDSDWDLV